MAPKAAAGTENEDVKFLLAIIKQLDGTVSPAILPILRAI
jgi:hypothetical protein